MAVKSIILIPAYGRDYSTAEKAIADFAAGKDFTISDISHKYNGKYCSIRDLKGYKIKIRFNKLADFVFVQIMENGEIWRKEQNQQGF